MTGAKIADKTITNSNIADYAIGQNQLAQACIPNNRIQNGAVDDRCIASGAVKTDKIEDDAVTLEKCGFSPYVYESYAGDLDSKINTGLYIISNTSSSTAAQYHYPKKGGTQYVGGFMYTAALSDSFISQVFIPTNVDAPTIAYRLMRKSGTSYVISDWKFVDELADGSVTAAKLSETYLGLHTKGDTSYNADLNTVTESGIYTAYCYDDLAASKHFPAINDVQCAAGTLLVMKNEVGISDPNGPVTQVFIAIGTQDAAAGDGTCVSGIAVRTLKYADSAYTPVTDWTDVRGTGLAVYSEIPQRIGTWIDGTPVWRIAFDEDLDGEVTTFDLKIAKTNENVLILSRSAYTTANNDDIIDCAKIYEELDDAATWTVNVSAQGTLQIRDIHPSSDHLYGFVDYATPEDNLPE